VSEVKLFKLFFLEAFKLERKAIPALKPTYGKPVEILFAWPHEDKKIIRIFRDNQLSIEIQFADCIEENICAEIYANFPSENGNTGWKFIPFEKISLGRYKLDYSFCKCGLFEFRVKYSFDNGSTWFWDHASEKKVFVDPPEMRSIRVYTLIPTVSGTITEWKKMLTQIKEMGFNAIHLLPVTKMGSSESPYSATDLFEIDPSYIDPLDPADGITQFESFVEEAKKTGIKLFLDIVVNHINPESNLAQDRPEWIIKDSSEKDGFKRAGATHMNSWIRWDDLVLINYANSDKIGRAHV
jgi:hypothetical protein